VTVFGTLRVRFALLYASAFLVSVLVVLAVAFAQVKQTARVGSSAPAVTTHPTFQAIAHSIESVTSVVTALVALLVLSVAFGWLLAGRLLRPVRVITATARDISASNLSRRLRLGRRDDEFARLGQTLNDLFARLEASFVSQRHFVANASHELRTPLTAERTLIQVALADPAADAATLREACEQVLALGTQQERMIDALLTLATSERGISQREPFDLAEIARKVVCARSSAKVRLDAGLDGGLDAGLDLAPAVGDPRLAESLIANLVDNALKYNVPGGWVSVRTGTVAGRGVVSVRNTGPVIAPDQVDRLFEPFQRLGGERTQRADGHGLGLAIVRAIADAHGAEVTARARDGGGLDIEVAFPSAH
jgi:signal transduction histidine kinase